MLTYLAILAVTLLGIFAAQSAARLSFSWDSYLTLLVTHLVLLTAFALVLFALIVFWSTSLYWRQLNLSAADYPLWLEQRATRTLWPSLLPVHDWLRLHSRPYRWWHTRIYAEALNSFILLVAVIGAVFIISAPAIKTLADITLHASNFDVSGINNPTNVDALNSVTVTAFTIDGDVMINYNGTIHFTSSDGSATLPGDYKFVAGDTGTHTFTNSVIFGTTGNQWVKATEVGGSASGSQTVLVNAAIVTHYNVTGISSPIVAGTPASVTVTAKDRLDKTVTSYTGTAHFTSTDPVATLPSNYTFVSSNNGTHTFTNGVTLWTAGTRTVTATDQSNSSITGSQTVTVTAGSSSGGSSGGGGTGGSTGGGSTGSGTSGGGGTTGGGTSGGTGGGGSGGTTTGGGTSGGGSSGGGGGTGGTTETGGTSGQTGSSSNPVTSAGQNGSTAWPLAAATGLSSLLVFEPVQSAVATGITGLFTTGSPLFNFLFLGYLPKRRQKRWGTVRDAETKVPIPGIFVLLKDPANRLVKKAMTDKTGQFAFTLERAGDYYLSVENPLYDRYASGQFKVDDPRREIISPDILLHAQVPVRDRGILKAATLITLLHAYDYIQKVLLIAGTAVALLLVIQAATFTRVLVLDFYLLCWLLELLGRSYRREPGKIIDQVTAQPQANSVVQLIADKNDGAFKIRSVISDSLGRYLFAVKNDNYQLVAAKTGYQPTELKVDGNHANSTIKLNRSTTAQS